MIWAIVIPYLTACALVFGVIAGVMYDRLHPDLAMQAFKAAILLSFFSFAMLGLEVLLRVTK